MSRKQLTGLVLAGLLFAAIILLPGIKNLDVSGQRCLALFVAVFVLYIFESLPASVISIAIVPLLVVLRITDVGAALSGFSSTSTYLVIGSFILAAGMVKSGLGRRITCFVLMRVGTEPIRLSFGLMLVNIIMAFMIPSSTARTVMLLPICISIIEQFKGESKAKVRYAINILLTLCITSSTISAGILTSTISNPMAVDYIQSATGQLITFGQWFVWGFPPALLMTVVSWLIIQLIFRVDKVENENGREYLEAEIQKMGKIKRAEVITAAAIAFSVLLWIFGSGFGIDSTSVALLGAVMLFIPKLSVLEWEDCQKNVYLSVVFIISGGISLGAAMAKTGASAWLADQVFGFISSDMGLLAVVIIVIVIVQFMHAFFVGTATMANAFFPILISVAAKVNVNAACIIMPAAFMIGGYPVLFFFNTTPNILCYDAGYIKAVDFLKIGIPISVAACLVYSLCAYLYWPMSGLL
jgi:anion transporter